jgi:hypothetical protein
MTPPVGRLVRNPRLGQRTSFTKLKRLGLALLLAGLVYLAWPYLALWGLSRAVASPDPEALSNRVDLAAVRGEIRRKLNKDSPSAIGRVSDPFIQWLERGIQRLGTGALDELVTLDWVRELLNGQSQPGQGFLPRVSYAFFDAPGGFAVRLDAPDRPPLHFRMTLDGVRWMVTAVYY